MTRHIDIRDRAYLSGSEVVGLNFIKDSKKYVFRKYYRTGLRSHIFEILAIDDVKKETHGEVKDGIRLFPRAKPRKILRILRNRFENKEQVYREIKKYKILLEFLGPDQMAESEEFIADYTGTGTPQIILCGLQDYIDGEILDPWTLQGKNRFQDFFKSLAQKDSAYRISMQKALENIARFIGKIRKMIDQSGYIPDLAGFGNLIVTPRGDIKLVDINNIVEISFDNTIPIDDKGYPSCDVSVSVLSMLEQDILQTEIDMDDPLYKIFLSPERRKKVRALEKNFNMNL